jgi:hypothetical protein
VPCGGRLSLTEAGRTLREPLRALEEWSIAHLGDVSASQEAHDRGDRPPPESAEIEVSDYAVIDGQPHPPGRPAKVAGCPPLLHEHQGEAMSLAPGFGFLDRLADHCRLAASRLKPLLCGFAPGLKSGPVTAYLPSRSSWTPA